MNIPRSTLDYSALTLSTLCLLHCLLLPILAISLPIMGMLSEMEWLHRLFVVLAVPLSWLAVLTARAHPLRQAIRVLAVTGGIALVLGAFVEALHSYELILTVAGAILLSLAHGFRILFRSHRHGVTPG